MPGIWRLDVPISGKRVFPKKVLPNLAHYCVVPFFKLGCHCECHFKNEKLKAFEHGFRVVSDNCTHANCLQRIYHYDQPD
jgi:hypothetical protein